MLRRHLSVRAHAHLTAQPGNHNLKQQQAFSSSSTPCITNNNSNTVATNSCINRGNASITTMLPPASRYLFVSVLLLLLTASVNADIAKHVALVSVPRSGSTWATELIMLAVAGHPQHYHVFPVAEPYAQLPQGPSRHGKPPKPPLPATFFNCSFLDDDKLLQQTFWWFACLSAPWVTADMDTWNDCYSMGKAKVHLSRFKQAAHAQCARSNTTVVKFLRLPFVITEDMRPKARQLLPDDVLIVEYVRHPVDVLRSKVQGDLLLRREGGSVRGAARSICNQQLASHSILSWYNQSRVLTVRHEDLAADFVNAFGRISEFVGQVVTKDLVQRANFTRRVRYADFRRGHAMDQEKLQIPLAELEAEVAQHGECREVMRLFDYSFQGRKRPRLH